MSYKITYSKAFKKHYKKLSDTEKKQTKKKLKFFVENPTHPSLRTKKIQGADEIWESSVNMDISIIWFKYSLYNFGVLVNLAPYNLP